MVMDILTVSNFIIFLIYKFCLIINTKCCGEILKTTKFLILTNTTQYFSYLNLHTRWISL